MTRPWIDLARDQLLRLRGDGPGWAYRRNGQTSVEPTVLACLALMASSSGKGPDSSRDECDLAVEDGARWIAGLQQADGAVGLSETIQEPHWPTSYAVLLWSAVEKEKWAERMQRAGDFILLRRGLTSPLREDGVAGHNTTIPGWPWVEETHSWVEPTAMAVLALQKCGYREHGRVAQGRDLLIDRMISTGGWNYGNSVMFGATLRPRPAPTGLAMLALLNAQGARLDSSLNYLERELPTIRSPQSLCWGLLAMQAWNRPLSGAADWLEEAYDQIEGCSDPSVQLSFLLLASGDRTLTHLGLASPAVGVAG